jgi:hypothetical protein
MKKLLVFLLIACCCCQLRSQTVSTDDFMRLVPYLEQENWKPAFELSYKILKSTPGDTSDLHAKVVYIIIFSAAGMVTVGDMNYKTLKKNIMKYEGQKVIMPFHPYYEDNSNPISVTSFTLNDSTNQAFTPAANAAGTCIFCFEIVKIKDKINVSDYLDNTLVQCGGSIESIETNPNQSTIWVVRLTVKDGYIIKDE